MILSRYPQPPWLMSGYQQLRCLSASLHHRIRKATKTSPCASWTRKARVRVEEGHDESSCSLKFKGNPTAVVLSIFLPSSVFFTLLPPPERKTSGPGKGQFSIESCDSFIFICTACCHRILYLYYNCYHLSTFSQSSYIYFSYFYFPYKFYKHWNTLNFQKHIQLSGCLTVAF